MNLTGFVRFAAASPRVSVADPHANAKEMLALAERADAQGASVVVFPELALSGYTCGDLFFAQPLQHSVLEALDILKRASGETRCALVVGLPLVVEGLLCNCAAVLQAGQIAGVVPKKYPARGSAYDERRWFAPGQALTQGVEHIDLLGESVPFGALLFRSGEEIVFGVELGSDAEALLSPGTALALAGADVVCCPDAAIHTAGSGAERAVRIAGISERYRGACVYASAGPTESTAEAVFSGHTVSAALGKILQEGETLRPESGLILSDIDVQSIRLHRLRTMPFEACDDAWWTFAKPRTVTLPGLRGLSTEDRLLVPPDRAPYIPDDPESVDAHLLEIFSIQAVALAERLRRAHARTAVIGASGGSDSTLALLVAAKAMQLSDRPASDVLAVSMPGFGTTSRTKNNASRLVEQLGCSSRNIPIHDAVSQHFRDIGHDPSVTDVTYENAQARERTQILMDLANQTGGFVVGTGDLSEMALGWCTFNADHMSMYAVNTGLPKTLVRRTIEAVCEAIGSDPSLGSLVLNQTEAQGALRDILDTPISPELLPLDEEGGLQQETEEVVGPYELHDFFLYHLVERAASPERVLWLAGQAFEGDYEPAVVRTWLEVFIRRFISQQFKRNSLPDGPRLISLSMSPRSGFRTASDASASAWLRWLE